MTLQDVDSAIDSWNAGLGAAAQNLMDLQGLPAYQRLAGTQGVPQAKLTGETAAAVEPMLTSVSRLLQYFDLLRHMLMRAESLRKDMPMFGGEQRIQEIEHLLGTPSIQLPAEAVPLDRRTLLSSTDSVARIAPVELVKRMTDAFEQVKAIVLKVDTAWETLGRGLDSAMVSIEALRNELSAAELSLLAASLDTAKAKAEGDPLAALKNFQTVMEPALAQVRVRLEETRAVRREIENGLFIAHSTLDALLAAHAEAVAAHREVSEKVAAEAPARPAIEATVQGLKDWLHRLESRYRQGTLGPILTGLRNWNQAVEDCVSSERRVVVANRAPLEMRAELRGRMDALKAKARARNVAETDALCGLAEEARELLSLRPTELGRAASAVEAYEKQLNAIR